MEDKKIRIAITQGDTNGVGYEVILKTFSAPEMLELCTPIVYGHPRVASYHRKGCNLATNFTPVASADDAVDGELNIIPVDENEVTVNFGLETPIAGRQALLALEAAVTDWKLGKVDALVTAPINKHAIQCDSFHFAGHTEYIESSVGDGDKALMILMNSRVRVALVTTHLPVARIAEAITQETIVEKLTLFNTSLKRDFGIGAPRIAVLSLNPHKGDGGLLGSEEQEIIIPAIEEAAGKGIGAFGPYAADGFFGSAAYDHFDGVLAMYHDQGLAPFKAIAMDDGINFTAGLPLVRTSPDHGTAYDIAGKGIADENSFRQAVYTAIDVTRNREAYDLAHENPLEKLYRERREDERRPFREKPVNKRPEE